MKINNRKLKKADRKDLSNTISLKLYLSSGAFAFVDKQHPMNPSGL